MRIPGCPDAFCALAALLAGALLACGGGGGGSARTATAVSATSVVADSGLTPGGASKTSTQTLTGSLPNPSGSATSFDGKAYLIVNGTRIPLAVASGSTASLAGARTFAKDGRSHRLDRLDPIAGPLAALKVGEDSGTGWIFTVTFSINAGPNTLSIDVYDLNQNLFAQMAQWTVLGAVQPTSALITLWWDTDGTDLDLHMSPDDGVTHCFYGNPTAGQMQLDYDNTTGYGPEHITIDNATGVNTYAIKVYYYADHNVTDPPVTTATTAHVTASVNGTQILAGSQLMTAASSDSSWTEGSQVWDVGSIQVSAPDRYDVVLSDPDLGSFPSVQLTVTVTDPDNPAEPQVTGLAAANFYVVNAGRVMTPVTLSAAGDVYTLTFTDVVSGKRDLYVYVVSPAQGTAALKAGLSNVLTYGTSYAVLAGLNEYPAENMANTEFSWVGSGAATDYVRVTVKAGSTPDGAGDFSITLVDKNGVDPSVTVAPTAITPAPAAGTTTYRLDFAKPANYADFASHGSLQVVYKKEDWLNFCVKDVNDLMAALLAKGTGMTASRWDSANITTFLDAGATKAAILDKIQSITQSMQSYDLFLFFFSGHGSGMPADGNAAQYLCAYEDGKWISVNDLKDVLDLVPDPGSHITNALVLMDACHSGNFIGQVLEGSLEDPARILPLDRAVPGAPRLKCRPFIPQANETPGPCRSFAQDLASLHSTLVMAAQVGSSFSWDDGTLKNGVFTHYLVEGSAVSGKTVSAALANADHDPWVTAEEAFGYLSPKVQAWVTTANGYDATAFQTPELQDNNAPASASFIYNW